MLFSVLLLVSFLYGCNSRGQSNQNDDDMSSQREPLDPLVGSQWYMERKWSEGVDLSYASLDSRYAGDGVVVAVVDDGMDHEHEDLTNNFSEALSYNYINLSGVPNAGAHGTHNAGIIAAEANNGRGISGIAPKATLASFNLLVNPDSVNEADAMVRNLDAIDVSNNSWGPPDGNGELWSPGELWNSAVELGVTQGREGNGIVYVWGGGNGQPTDSSNYDGYANSPYVIAVGSVTERGILTLTSEPGANIWISAPTEGDLSGYDVVTTDVSGERGANSGAEEEELEDNNYTQRYRGTSAATAQVSGVVALMLSANPLLTWRDVRMILARSAFRNDELDPGWTTNGSAFRYAINHQYGFGLIDAGAAVDLAVRWPGLPPMHARTYRQSVNAAVPDGSSIGVASTITVPSSEALFVEYVTVNVNIPDHLDFGDLTIELRSPAGTTSQLAVAHRCRSLDGRTLSRCTSTLSDWEFGVGRLLEESSTGDWSLSVKDSDPGYSAEWLDWGLTIYGYQ